MANEGGGWIMRGMSWDDPYRIRTWKELVNWINERLLDRVRELYPHADREAVIRLIGREPEE